MSEYNEQPISPQGIVGTTLIHLLLLLIFFFTILSQPYEYLPVEGVMVNFGTSDEGWGNEQPIYDQATATANDDPILAETEKEAATPPPAPAAAANPDESTSAEKAASEKIVTSDADPKAPALPTKKDDVKKDNTPPKTTPTPKNNTATNTSTNTNNNTTSTVNDASSANTPKQPSIDNGSLFKGGNKNSSQSQGNTPNSTGDSGKNMGSVDIPSGGSTGGNGTSGNNIDFNLQKRKLVSIPKIIDSSQDEGRVVIKIKVNRNGDVIDAQFTSSGSTTSSSILRNKALEAARKAKFNADSNAAEVQQGTMTFKFIVE